MGLPGVGDNSETRMLPVIQGKQAESLATVSTTTQTSHNPTTTSDKDSFVSKSETTTNAPSNDGNLSYWECLKNFVKGPLKDLKAIITNPAETILAGLALVTAAAFIPVALVTGISIGLGVAYGLYGGAKGIGTLMHASQNGNADAVEKSFEDIGSSAFSILTSGLIKNPIKNALKFFGKTTKNLINETFHWFKKVYSPKLKELQPGAIVFGAFSFAEGLHVGHSLLNLNATGVLLGLSGFALAKYTYMGFHYKDEIKATAKALKESPSIRRRAVEFFKKYTPSTIKDFFSQLSKYIFKGDKSSPLGVFAELDLSTSHARKILASSLQSRAIAHKLTATQQKELKKVLNLLVEWGKTTKIGRKMDIEKQLQPYLTRLHANLSSPEALQFERQLQTHLTTARTVIQSTDSTIIPKPLHPYWTTLQTAIEAPQLNSAQTASLHTHAIKQLSLIDALTSFTYLAII